VAEERPQGGEATEPASDRKLKQARKRGEVAKSKELVSWAVFAGVCATIAWSWSGASVRLQILFRSVFSSAAQSPEWWGAGVQQGIETLALTLLPILAVAMIVALMANFAQTGALLTFQPLKPQLRRLDPVANARQILGKQAWFELLKSLVKIFGSFVIAASAIWDHGPRLLGTLGRSPAEAVAAVSLCLGILAVRLGIFFAFLALVDVFVQRISFAKRMRMTKEEVKREYRDSEGDPQHKAERQRLHREITTHQMTERVSTADCVVINPTRLAVALKYDGEEDRAPRIMAQGKRLVAAQIRDIARQHGVAIIRDVPLARALLELEIDDEIPEELYQAVAEILRFVYRIRRGDNVSNDDLPKMPMRIE
jgi:flagellar biosynthesis protein FlhB